MRICKDWIRGKQIKNKTQNERDTILKREKQISSTIENYKTETKKQKNKWIRKKKRNWIETKTKETRKLAYGNFFLSTLKI